MESDIMPLHPSFPPPLNDDDDDGGMGLEDDEIGEFGEFSDALGIADCTETPSSLRQPSSTLKTAARQPNWSCKHPAERSQPAAAGSGGGQVDAESSFHLTNGYAGRYLNSGTHAVSISTACSRNEETGFASFTVFTEQAAHPWCCGFSVGDADPWGGGMGGTNSVGEKLCEPAHGIIMDFEPRSHCLYKAQENGCAKVKHCEKRDVAFMQSSQDHCQSQEAATAFDRPSHPERKQPGMVADSQQEGGQRLDSLQISELQDYREPEEDGEDGEKSVSPVPQTFSEYESAAEDLGPLCEEVSFECPSEDLETNISSLVLQEDRTDWDQTDVEEDQLGDCRLFESKEKLRQTEAEKGSHHCDQSVTQETTATSDQSSANYTDDEFFGFKDSGSEHCRGGGLTHMGDSEVQTLGSLPPSDSFADFCSAPTQEDGDGGLWAEFNEEGKTWTQLREEVSSPQTDGDAEEKHQHGTSRKRSCQASLSCRVQQLLQASFPEVVVPAVEVEEVSSFGALFQATHLLEGDEEEQPKLCHRVQWAKLGLWWPHHDVHCAVGLQFQWGGSHTNRILLRCLGVNTSNVVFIGIKKQMMAVPAFASSLGMLEPTKDSLPAVSVGHRVITAQAPPRPPQIQEPSTEAMQEVLPSRQLDWGSRGLSSSQDGCSALNLDYFGPEEESRSSSSSRGNTPPPGVDRELYALTICKVETSVNSCCLEDILNQLWSTAEKTSTSVRKPQQDEGLSAEAGRLISELPNLSFMQAKVLMFPSILLPKD